MERIASKSIDHWVLMTHRFDIDLQYLEAMAGHSWQYLGVMGPASRKAELLEHASPQAKALLQEPCMHSPIGLDIGSDAPEEIALSCCAEILANISKRQGGKLSLSSLSIHPKF